MAAHSKAHPQWWLADHTVVQPRTRVSHSQENGDVSGRRAKQHPTRVENTQSKWRKDSGISSPDNRNTGDDGASVNLSRFFYKDIKK